MLRTPGGRPRRRIWNCRKSSRSPLLTGLNFGGGSEFAAVELWTTPPNLLVIGAIVLLVNSRNLLMGAAFAPLLRRRYAGVHPRCLVRTGRRVVGRLRGLRAGEDDGWVLFGLNLVIGLRSAHHLRCR